MCAMAASICRLTPGSPFLGLAVGVEAEGGDVLGRPHLGLAGSPRPELALRAPSEKSGKECPNCPGPLRTGRPNDRLYLLGRQVGERIYSALCHFIIPHQMSACSEK